MKKILKTFAAAAAALLALSSCEKGPIIKIPATCAPPWECRWFLNFRGVKLLQQ